MAKPEQRDGPGFSIVPLSPYFTVLFEWEIFVPDAPIAKHEKWDKEVMEITTGLTLLGKVTGKWLDPQKRETSIRVSLVCTEEAIVAIAHLTKTMFNQQKILVIQRGRALLI